MSLNTPRSSYAAGVAHSLKNFLTFGSCFLGSGLQNLFDVTGVCGQFSSARASL